MESEGREEKDGAHTGEECHHWLKLADFLRSRSLWSKSNPPPNNLSIAEAQTLFDALYGIGKAIIISVTLEWLNSRPHPKKSQKKALLTWRWLSLF
jgi:hypothetical protein